MGQNGTLNVRVRIAVSKTSDQYTTTIAKYTGRTGQLKTIVSNQVETVESVVWPYSRDSRVEYVARGKQAEKNKSITKHR